MNLEQFAAQFDDITDPRQSAKVTYPLFDILFTTLCSMIAGAKGWHEIRLYTIGHLDWFHRHNIFLEGVPIEDTFARVFAKICPNEFRKNFIGWMSQVNKITAGELIAIDGKTLRHSYQRDDKASAIHMINAFACKNKLVLGQLKTDKKSNEITAIPELIRLLDIKGALVSMDAMGCQTEIADLIVEKKADYLLAVKGNQGTLSKAIQSAFKHVTAEYLKEHPLDVSQGRGRVEARGYYTLNANALDGDFSRWAELKTLGMSLGYRLEKGKQPQLEQRYYISSAALDDKQLGQAIRGHWAIENSLHWVLDVTMSEDACKIHKDHSAENLAAVRQAALNMLRKGKSKLSIASKQKMCWMKMTSLEDVLVAGFAD